MDVLREADKLPHFDQKVVMKVARLNFGAPKRSSHETSGLVESHARPAPPAPRADAATLDFAPL